MGWVDRVISFVRAVRVRCDHRRTLERLRRESRVHKIRVAFLVSELAKWKCQSVYDRLCDSSQFEPFIAVCNLTRQARMSLSEQQAEVRMKLDYFTKRGMAVVDIQKYGTKHTLSADEIGADILFYQQPWDLPEEMRPWVVSRRALTFYVPYYLWNTWHPQIDIGHKMHHFLFGYIVCNEEMAALYEELQDDCGGAYTTRYLPFGHPALDGVSTVGPAAMPQDGCVIYAPHWSLEYGGFVPPLKHATFSWSGCLMLDYAKDHQEIRWAFKPHPQLKATLVKTGFMTQAEADAYYAEWERIGTACYAGPAEYGRLFAESRAMITDCGSFLVEYGCTGRPIVRMVNGRLNVDLHPMVEDLCRKYYAVHNQQELREALDNIVLLGRDPMRDERLYELQKLNLLGNDASGRIVNYLRELIWCAS